MAIKLATHLLGRVKKMLEEGGLPRWRTFVNQATPRRATRETQDQGEGQSARARP